MLIPSRSTAPDSEQRETPLIERPGDKEIDRAIRKALGKDKDSTVSYKSLEQFKALRRILVGDDPALVVVLPTGGGKTLLFTAGACLDDPGVIVVIVPYRKLVDETVRNARAKGINYIEWKYSMFNPANMVVVSVDNFPDRFLQYARMMVRRGLLRKVFIDECYLVRPKLAHISEVRAIGMPLVLLTATLLVYIEGELEAILARTARPKTRYTVKADIDNGKLRETTVRVVSKIISRLRAREKVIVYYKTIVECKAMAEQLECSQFYAGYVDKDESLQH
ncbi:hypothetical protein D6C80_06309 [Aureobasidium pullulans]|nr:hypothetical protein D6C80_06309 [Aureobasidium pullulans]